MQRVRYLARAQTDIHRFGNQRRGLAIAAKSDVLQQDMRRGREAVIHRIKLHLPGGVVA